MDVVPREETNDQLHEGTLVPLPAAPPQPQQPHQPQQQEQPPQPQQQLPQHQREPIHEQQRISQQQQQAQQAQQAQAQFLLDYGGAQQQQPGMLQPFGNPYGMGMQPMPYSSYPPNQYQQARQ